MPPTCRWMHQGGGLLILLQASDSIETPAPATLNLNSETTRPGLVRAIHGISLADVTGCLPAAKACSH